MKNKIKVIIFVNDLSYFISHRLGIARAAQRFGYEVNVVYGELGNADLTDLAAQEINLFPVPMRRGGINPLRELWALFSVWRLFRRLKPDIVHLVTIKPYLYGGLAARLSRVPCVVSAVAGLGSVFVRQDRLGKLFRSFLYPLFRFAFNHSNQLVIVQNADDHEVLVRWGVLRAKRTRLLHGSGAPLSEFPQTDEPDGLPVVSFAARLLRDKGVIEFVDAARLLHSRGVKARFWLIGGADRGNPTSVSEQELVAWQEEGIVEVLGYRKDIAALYAQSNIVCLPSYREGLPKSLIEAAAAGRAVVTTDVPGCRDAIIPNETGLLVQVQNTKELADAVQWLIEHPKERAAMGRAGRKLAEREFDLEKIVNAHLQIYRELLENAR